MPHRKWSFLVDPFLTAGKRNYKKAYDLAKYTDSVLAANTSIAFVLALYNNFHPLFLALQTAYNAWRAQGGTQEGATETLDNLLFQLASGDVANGITSLINDWDLEVQNVFRKGTPTYKTIFPDLHKPFQSGEKDDRIDAVAALSIALNPHAALVATKTAVDAFLLLLNTARADQQGQMGTTVIDSTAVSAAVNAAMIGMFAVYGGLILNYAATPDDAGAYFDLELLRDLQQMQFLKSLAPTATVVIAKRTLPVTRKAKFTVLSAKPITFSIVEEKNDKVGVKKITVNGLEDETIEIGTIMNGTKAAFFIAENSDPDVDGHVKVEILPQGS